MSKNLEGVLVKQANRRQTFTHDEIKQFAECADPNTGPAYFLSNYFYIQHPTKGRLLYKPFDFQDELIEIYHNNRFSINLLGRQMGKTTTAAGYLLWYAMFKPDSTILIAAHKYVGAQEIMQRIRYAYELCPDHIRAGVVSYNKGSIDFENGSRIVSTTTTETTGRGMSITLLYCDEFAFVRNTIAREFWTSISPTLATGGKAIITSTPNSDDDQFWMIWKGANRTIDVDGNETEIGENGFKGYMAKWNRHPDRDDVWAAQERHSVGTERFQREHECEPIIWEETLINSMFLASMEGTDPILKQGTVRWYKKPNASSTYIVALDPSLGTGGDPAAIQVFEAPSMQQVAEWRHNKTPIPQQIQILKAICTHIAEETRSNMTNIYYSVENNTIGEAALISIADVGEENIPGIFLSEPKRAGNTRTFRKGFNTTNRVKLASCAKLKTLIESHKLHVKSKPLISELKNFIASGGSYAAKQGETDDLVMSTILALRIANELKNYVPELESSLRDGTDDYDAPMPFIIM